MKVQLDTKAVEQVKKAIRQIGFDANKQIKIGIGKAAGKVKIAAARQVRTALKVKVSILKKAIRIKRPPSDDILSQIIILGYGYPIPLKYFGAQQTEKGVTYKIDPRFRNKSTLQDAFILDRYKGHVFRRSGKNRGPLIRMNGPAPGDVYEKAGVVDVALKKANEELPKQIRERLRYLIVKAQGKLKGRQK